MINVVIVEDEYMVAKRLHRFVDKSLSAYAKAKIKVLHQLADAQDYMAEHQVDVLFLDLNLTGQDGFDLLKTQLSKSFHTIVVSANTDRALEAFEFGVLDFVAKPFTQQRIDKACGRLFTAERLGGCKYLTYQTGKSVKMLPIEDIEYLRADGHYSEIFNTEGDCVLHEKNLDALLKVLPKNIFRIHRSYAVNLLAIDSLTASAGSKYQLTLTSGHQLPVGRTRIQALREAMNSGL